VSLRIADWYSAPAVCSAKAEANQTNAHRHIQALRISIVEVKAVIEQK